jgi:hypothetical protein
MDQMKLEELGQRMTKIYQENRLLRLFVGGFLAILLFFFLTGVTLHKHQVVEAEQFIIKDHEGKVRGSFGLVASSDMPSLTFYDKETNANVLLHLREDGSPALWLYNKDRIRSSLAVWGDRTLLEIFDKKNHQRMVLGVSDKGEPGLEFYGPKGKLRTVLGNTTVARKPTPGVENKSINSLVFYDKHEKSLCGVLKGKT